MAIHEVYCLCCCYIYDLPISEKSIESILRYIKGNIVAKGALLNKVATEIAMTCSDIDRYLANKKKQFQYAFIDMQDAIKLNDTQWVIDVGNHMLFNFDEKAEFKSQDEFDILMEQEGALTI